VFWYLIISALIEYYQIIKISFAKLSLFAFQLDANLVTRFWSSVWSLLHLWWSDNFECSSGRGSSSVNICKAIHKLGFLNPVLCLFNELYKHVFPIKMLDHSSSYWTFPASRAATCFPAWLQVFLIFGPIVIGFLFSLSSKLGICW